MNFLGNQGEVLGTQSRSAQFSKLPLLEVIASFRIAEPIRVSLETLDSVRGALRDENLSAVRFKGGQIERPSFIEGEEDSFTFGNFETGLGVDVWSEQFSVSWRLVEESVEYVRYARIADVAQRLWGAIGTPAVVNAALTYTIVDASGDPVSKIMTIPDVSPEWLAQVVEFNVARKVSDQMEYRLHIENISPKGIGEDARLRVIRTTGGIFTNQEDNPVEALTQICHNPMQDTFADMLTPDAKERWGFNGVH